MKKIISSLGMVSAIVAPTVVTISCDKKEVESSDGFYISYWPDVDPAIALGAKIAGASKSSGHFATWFPKNSKYEKALKGIKEIKPLFDADTTDEEYWRNLNGGEKVNLVHEYWIKAPQKKFLMDDTKINPIQFDYNAGKSGQKYEWEITGTSGKEPTKILIQNKGTSNYEDPGDLWQIRDMGEILKIAAKSLDKASSNPTDKIYESKVEEIMKATDDHWSNFRLLQENSDASLKEFTDQQLTERQKNLKSNRVDDANTGSTTHDPRLLILNIKTGAASASSNDTIKFSTPSMAQEAYTKTHFTMPSLSKKQFDVLKKYTNLNNGGEAIVSSSTGNGVYFPYAKNSPLTQDFWSEWNDDLDKLVVGIGYKELLANEDNPNYFYDLYNGEKNKAGSTGKILTDLIGDDLKPENTVFMDTYLAGSGSYGFRMPIGQNVFIDKMTKSFYDNWESKI